VLSRRYSHQRAARIASPLIALSSAAGGAIAARAIPGSPALIVNVVLWGVIGGFAGYIVFASEGPQPRPSSITQAAVADGVVAGIITALSGGLIDVISASGAGSSIHGSLTLGGAVLAVVFAGIFGALVGGAAGAVALAIGGQERFERISATRRKKAMPKTGARPRPSSQKQARRRHKR
jgi:hypothetical protein